MGLLLLLLLIVIKEKGRSLRLSGQCFEPICRLTPLPSSSSEAKSLKDGSQIEPISND